MHMTLTLLTCILQNRSVYMEMLSANDRIIAVIFFVLLEL